jgi:hypothetical protein
MEIEYVRKSDFSAVPVMRFKNSKERKIKFVGLYDYRDFLNFGMAQAYSVGSGGWLSEPLPNFLHEYEDSQLVRLARRSNVPLDELKALREFEVELEADKPDYRSRR